MPELARVLTEEDLRARSRVSHIDLTPYTELLDAVRQQSGVGGLLTLAEGESQRTEKRRLSIAAKEQGCKLTWRKSQPGELRFVLAEAGKPTPGARRGRPPKAGTKS